MKITPFTNTLKSNHNFGAKFAKTKALEDYVSYLNSDDTKLFAKNKKLMESVDDGDVYMFTCEDVCDDEGNRHVRANMLKNGKKFLDLVFDPFHIYDGDKYLGRNFEGEYRAFKSLFDTVFDKYNPNRKNDEESINIYNRLAHKNILKNCETPVYNFGNISQCQILDGKEGYYTVCDGCELYDLLGEDVDNKLNIVDELFDSLWGNVKLVFDKDKKLIQKYDYEEGEDFTVVYDYDDKMNRIRRFFYDYDKRKVTACALADETGELVYRKIDENGNLTEPY